MSYWDKLPSDLQNYIYEFDVTWINIYNDLMKECPMELEMFISYLMQQQEMSNYQ